MTDKINNNTSNYNNINGISEKSFNKLNDEQKNTVLTGNNETQNKDKDGGCFGKILGANTRNASIHIAFIICCVLLLFCGIDLFHSFGKDNVITAEIWNLIFPIVTLALGYIFGKGETK